jgi:kynurenine formamidase
MKIVELSVRIDENTPVYPGDAKPKIERAGKFEDLGWNVKRFTFNSHFATHIDAPYHMLKDGKKLDELPLETFAGPGVILDASKPKLSLVKEGDIVFFCTCNNEEQEFYEDKFAIPKDVAQKLIDKKIRMVGFDLPGPDFPPYELHNLFFKNNIPIAENLVNLKSLINTRCKLYALPLFIRDSDGAPCRAIAILD